MGFADFAVVTVFNGLAPAGEAVLALFGPGSSGARGLCRPDERETSMSGGLEGVVAAETVLSHTDSAAGMVWVRGHDLPDLVANHGFEGTVALLWEGFAEVGLSRTGVLDAFGQARVATFAELDSWLDRARGRTLFEGMRLGLAFLRDT